MKKIASLILVLLMLCPLLFSCQDNEIGADSNPKPDGDVIAPDGDVNLEEKDPEGFVQDRLPQGEALEALGFAGSNVRILSWDEEEAQTFPKEDSTQDPLKNKLYNHYRGIEERLDITFKPEWCSSHNRNYNQFLTTARSDTVTYDLIQTQSLFPAALATEGRLCNLRNLGYPDLEMPWWPDSVDQWTQAGSLFFIASNSSAMGISNMAVIFINDGMITSKGASSPIQSVLRGTWTVEEMANVAKLFAGTAEAAEEHNRIYGFVVDDISRMDPMYYACGFNSIVKNADGVAEFGYDDESELIAITNALNQFEALMTGPQVLVHPTDDPTEMNEGRTAMLLGYMQYIRQLEKTEDYTVVPLPMLNTDQYDTMGYRTTHRDWMDVWCMPVTVENKVLCGMVLEAMASSEYRTIGPFYFEQYLKDRYANGADGRKCFDILRDSVIYDFGRAMQVSAIGAEDYWRPCFWVGGNLQYGNVFAEKYRASSGERIQNLQKLLENYAKYKDN